MQAVSASATHNTAGTQVAEAAGVRFAYRRFGFLASEGSVES